MNKTQAQLNAERAWRGALIKFVEHDSDFNVDSLVVNLERLRFNKEGEMIEHGSSYAYLKRHTPSLMGIWRTLNMEESNGKNKSDTKITRRGRRKATPDR
jgi:hypothetical protein